MRKWLRSFMAVIAIVGVSGALASHSHAATSWDESPAEPPPVFEGRATTPDGVELYYRVVGSGDEVVVAPFALYHGAALDPLARGRRIVTYDPRGRGRSAAVALDKVSLDMLLVDLDTVRRAVGAERIAIIGWSGGGMESFVYALRNPGRVTRLVQLAPVAPRFDPYGAQMMEDRQARTDAAAAKALEAQVQAGAFAADPGAHCRADNAVSTPALLADAAAFRLLPDVCQWRNEHAEALGSYFGALFQSIDGYDWRPSLPQVTVPRLVIHAAQDNIPLAGNEEWVRGQPNARLLLIDGSGHFPHYEQPEATLSAIDAFLAGAWPKGSTELPAQPAKDGI